MLLSFNCRISGERLRAVSCGCLRGLDANRLTMPCSSKASALRSKLVRGSPVSCARPIAGSRDLDDGAQEFVSSLLREDAYIVEWFASSRYARAPPACVWAPCSLQHDEM